MELQVNSTALHRSLKTNFSFLTKAEGEFGECSHAWTFSPINWKVAVVCGLIESFDVNFPVKAVSNKAVNINYNFSVCSCYFSYNKVGSLCVVRWTQTGLFKRSSRVLCYFNRQSQRGSEYVCHLGGTHGTSVDPVKQYLISVCIRMQPSVGGKPSAVQRKGFNYSATAFDKGQTP